MDNYDQFKQVFIVECVELLADMEAKLLDMDLDNPSDEDMNAIFRCAHSIKGGAGAFQLNDITKFTHVMETLLDKLRDHKIKPTKEMIDCLLKSSDVLSKMVDAAKNNTSVEESLYKPISDQLSAFMGMEAGAEQKMTSVGSSNVPDANTKLMRKFTVSVIPKENMLETGNEPLVLIKALSGLGNTRVKTIFDKVPDFDKLKPELCYTSFDIDVETVCSEQEIYEIFEFVTDLADIKIKIIAEFDVSKDQAKPSALVTENKVEAPVAKQEAATNTPAVSNASAGAATPANAANANANSNARTVTSIRVDLDKIDRLVNMVGEIVISQSMLYDQAKRLPAESVGGILHAVEELSLYSRELQEAVMSVRMQPVKSIFSRMPRLVRDLATQLNKDIKLEMHGEQTEIDKTVIELLGDPLTHMIRNSTDHGIEKPEDRIKKGKPAQGTIVLSAANMGGRIVIEVKDDGAGINRERVLQKAIDKGIVSANSNMTPEEIDQIIFLPGFSTAEAVTNVSGRGVGMDVVKKNIASLGGSIEIINNVGKGSSFIVSLPLTLAILDGMIVRVGQEKFIVPIENITETLRLKKDIIKEVSKGSYVVEIRGEFLSIFELSEIFNLDADKDDKGFKLIILLESNSQKYGLVVDELLGQQQVVIKSLETNSDPIDGISGATILGDGKVSLILDIGKLSLMYQRKLQEVNPTHKTLKVQEEI